MERLKLLDYPEGATPLDLDEIEGLLPKHITTQGQLNEWEQTNILEAEKWLSNKKIPFYEIATIEFTKKLHQLMFNKTWRWAGQFRQSNKNIGIDWLAIQTSLKLLWDDISYQQANNVYSVTEWAVRLHHRLVSIHPFPNGNGRHARLMTDILLLSQGAERFSWGSQSLTVASLVRKQYITALRNADKLDYELLIEFVKK